jgi:hypothetical protein
MKKIIILLAIIVCVVVAYQSGKPQLIDDTYQANGIVIEQNNGITTIETTDGNMWETYRVDGVSVGDRVMLTLDGHSTIDVTDDSIINIEAMG